jgi:hypothetical protein
VTVYITAEHTKFVTTTHTQEVYSQTTIYIRIIPTPTPSPNEPGTHPVGYLLNQSRHSPTTTVYITAEHTKLITTTHTQEVYSQTTIRICSTPTPSPSESGTHPMTPSVSTVYITTISESTSTPTSGIVLSNVVQIGILATSGVLICLPVLTLVIVTYCWIRTRRTLKKKRNEVNSDHSAQDR